MEPIFDRNGRSVGWVEDDVIFDRSNRYRAFVDDYGISFNVL